MRCHLSDAEFNYDILSTNYEDRYSINAFPAISSRHIPNYVLSIPEYISLSLSLYYYLFFFYRPVSLRNWKLAKISHERAAVNRQLIIKRRGNFLEEEVCKLKTLVSFRLLTLFETVLDNSLHGRKVYTRRNFLDRFLNEQDETLDFSQSRIHKSGIHAKYEYIRRMKINCMEFFELPLGWNFASCRTRWNQ